MAARAVRIIGPGRAGLSLARGLDKAGCVVLDVLGRGDVADAGVGADLLVIATPDDVVASVAASVAPADGCVVAHLAGALGLDVLAPHRRRASIHPLRSLPTTSSDLAGAWFAVAGDPLAGEVVADLDGRLVEVADDDRTTYHAAAVMASNHLVALLGAVERVAARAGVPLDAFLDLVRGTVDNVSALGPAGALTGPVARGDRDTVARHLAVLPEAERTTYEALNAAATHLLSGASGAPGDHPRPRAGL
ncbi:MAG TPA: DUF2520 domain-containing protein [Acidimicrobiales bacterium]|nr:DUF2520 domain-containing protein [Acidimicrobiales bacterium]